jgi:hypothetical protein
MNASAADSEAAARIVERLRDATNDHDPDGIAAALHLITGARRRLTRRGHSVVETRYAKIRKRSSVLFPT